MLQQEMGSGRHSWACMCTANARLAWIQLTGPPHVADGEPQGRCGTRGRSQLLPVDLNLLPLTPMSLGLNFPIFKMEMLSGPRTSCVYGTGDTVDEVTLARHSAQCSTMSSQGPNFVAFNLNELCERPS